MCCRCYIEYIKDEKLRKMYENLLDKENLKTEGEIYPKDFALVLTNDKTHLKVNKMRWGYDIHNKLVFNTRVETISEKLAFKDGINKNRCLIPVSNYFEWKKDDKQKYAIRNNESSVTYLAGIYRIENNEPVFSIVTKDAIEEIKFIHDSMPVILDTESAKKYLNVSRNYLEIFENSKVQILYKESE